MIASLLEKLKGAIRHPECLCCHGAVPSDTPFCLRCNHRLGLRDPYPLVRTQAFETHAATLFNPNIKKLLYSYKFYGQQHLAAGLSLLLVRYWARALENLPHLAVVPVERIVVVPVPAHAGRKPYLSSMARLFALHFGYVYDESLLAWERDITPQHKILQKRRRLENISHSMQVREVAAARLSRAELVIVLDDLTTTGATLFEATQAFQRAELHPAGIPQTKILGLALCSMPLALQKHLF